MAAGVIGSAYAPQVNPGMSGLIRPEARSGEAVAGRAGSVGMQSPAYSLELTAKIDKTDPTVRQLKRTGKIECQTCKERTYQDGSNDPGVSFKAPGHIAPESSAAVVMAHEQEHVANEQANAAQEDRQVVSQSVRLFSSVCPECGKVYVSGGETRTTTASAPKPRQNESPLGGQMDLRV